MKAKSSKLLMPSKDEIKFPELKTIPNPYSTVLYEVNIRTELLCWCPVNSQRDAGPTIISYTPGATCLEVLSLIAWVETANSLTVYHEELVGLLFDALYEALRPSKLEVRTIFNLHANTGLEVIVRKGVKFDKMESKLGTYKD